MPNQFDDDRSILINNSVQYLKQIRIQTILVKGYFDHNLHTTTISNYFYNKFTNLKKKPIY